MAESTRGLERRVLRRLAGLVPARGTVVVAVSGGSDSMALLAVLSALRPALGWRLRPAHVDHGLRPESGQEARWVQAQCYRRWGWPVRVLRAKVQRESGESWEAAARRHRYRSLNDFRAATGAVAIVLGHQWEDQAETVLMRVLTGTGVLGLRAMSVQRGCYLRPLLPERRATLRAYLHDLGVSWLEDPSNADSRWLRNRLRHHLVPLLRERYNPAVEQALWRLAQEAEEWAEWVEAVAERWLAAQGIRPDQLEWHLPAAFQALPRPLRAHLLLRYGSERGIRLTHAHISQALNGTTHWPDGWGVEHLASGGVRVGALSRQEPGYWPPSLFLPLRAGRVELPPGGRLAVGQPDAPFQSRLRLAPEALAVRFWRPGDRIRPVGLHGHKKLQDLFVDLKIPRTQRAGWPVLVQQADPDKVVAVVGLAVDEEAAGSEWVYGYWPPSPATPTRKGDEGGGALLGPAD